MSKPVEVWFDRIHLLLSPKFDWDEDDREEREQQIKQALLRRAELFAMHRTSQSQSEGGSATGARDHAGGGDSFIERLMTKLVDNVEFHVRNVHIRYEDHLSNPSQPFALGLTLSKLHLKSTNEHYQEVYVNRAGDKEAQRGIFKHIALHQLSAYCNLISEDNPLGSIDIDTCSYETWQSVFSKGVSSQAVGGDGHDAVRGSNLSQTSRSSSMSSLSSSSLLLTNELTHAATVTNNGDGEDDAPITGDSSTSKGSHHGASSGVSAVGGSGENPRARGATPQEMHYLLRPLDIDVRLRVNRDPFDLTSPRVRVQCRIDDFALELERSQYHALLFLSSAFESQARQARYRRFRPRQSNVSDDPKAWWLYAYNAVSLDIREHRARWTPEYFHTRRQDRLEYMLLWKRKRVGSAVRSADDGGNGLYRELSGYDRGRLERLEYRLDLEDIMFFRALAEKDLKKTESLRAAAEREYREAQRGGIVEIGSGLLSWVFSGGDGGGASPSGNSGDTKGDNNIVLSATERNKMLRDLKMDSKDANLTSFDYPKDYDMLCMDFSMENFHVNLTGNFKGCAAQVLCVQLSEVRVALAKRVDSQKIELSIDGLNIFDPCMHPKRLEHRIVRQREHARLRSPSGALSPKPSADSPILTKLPVQTAAAGSCGVGEDKGNEDDEHDGGEAKKPPMPSERNAHFTQSNPSIFSLTVELFSDSGAKSQARIRLVSGPLELIYSPRCLERVGRVFEYPNDLGQHMENAVADLNSLSSLEARAKAKLEFAMSSHARVDIDVRARAPVIIIPEQIEHESSGVIQPAGWNSMDPPSSLEEDIRLLFICDLGRFHVWSQEQNTDSLLNPSLAAAASSSSLSSSSSAAAVAAATAAAAEGKGVVDGEPATRRNSAFGKNDDKFYDRYRLRLSEIQMLLVRGAEPWRTAPPQTSTLVHKFECIVDLHASILPQDPTITRAKIYGKLPKIYGKMTTRMRRHLMQLMSSLKPDSALGSGEESASDLGGSGSSGDFDGSGQWSGVAASATAAAAGFGNPASSISLFARARSVAATFSPASGPSRAPRRPQAPGSSKLSHSMFSFPSPSAKYRRFTRSPSPLNIGLAGENSAFRSSTHATPIGGAGEGEKKTDANDTQKPDRRLFDLNLFLGSVVIDVSESSAGEEQYSKRRSGRSARSNRTESSVAQFALEALELTSSLGSRSMQAEIILSDVVVKDMRILNTNLATSIPECLRMVVSGSVKTKSKSDALIRIKYSSKDGVRNVDTTELGAGVQQSKPKYPKKSLRLMFSKIEVMLGQVRFRCNQRFLVRLQNVFVDSERLAPNKRMVSNRQFLNVSNTTTDRTTQGAAERALSKTAGTPSRLPTVDDGPDCAPPAPPPGAKEQQPHKNSAADLLPPTRLKVILSVGGVELFFDSDENLNATSLRAARRKGNGKRRHTLARVALLRSSATFTLESQDTDTVSFLLVGHVGNATLADFSNDTEVEVFGLRMLQQRGLGSLGSKKGNYGQDSSSSRKPPLVSTPSNAASPKFDRTGKDAYMFAPVHRSMSVNASTPVAVSVSKKTAANKNTLAAFQVSMNLRSDMSKLNASRIYEHAESDDHVRLSVTLRPVKCVLLASFVESTVRYIRDGSLMQSINEDKKANRSSRKQQQQQLAQKQPATAAAGTGSPLFLSVQIEMQNPLIVLPRSASSLEAVFIDLGNIEVTSKFTEQSSDPPSNDSESSYMRQKFTMRCNNTHIDCRFQSHVNAPIYKIVDDNTITIELETDIPGSVPSVPSPTCASASLSPIHVGINPELVSLMLLVWYENIAHFQNINWSVMPANSTLPPAVPPAESKSTHARGPSPNRARARSRKSPILSGAHTPKRKHRHPSPPIPSITSPSTSQQDMAPLNLDDADSRHAKAFDFTFSASEIKIVVLTGEKRRNSSKSPRGSTDKKGIVSHRRSVNHNGSTNHVKDVINNVSTEHATPNQHWRSQQGLGSTLSVRWDQPICTRILLVLEYNELVCFRVDNVTSHNYSNKQGDSELNLTVQSVLLEDCRPQNDRAPFAVHTARNLFSTLMHASCPSSLGHHEAAILLQKIYHSKRGDVDITLDLKGGPRIYFVPKAFEELSQYITDLLEETTAIQTEYASLRPKVAYSHQVAPKTRHSRPYESKAGSDNIAVPAERSITRQRKLLTDAKGEDGSSAGGGGGTTSIHHDYATPVDAPEFSFKLSASQPELWLIADPAQEQTWTISVSCSIELRAIFLRSPSRIMLIPSPVDYETRIDDGEWEMTEQRVTLDRCRVIARVASASDLRMDLATQINSTGEERRPTASSGRTTAGFGGVESTSGLTGVEHASGSGSRFRRRATVPLQIVDNFKLHADFSVKRTSRSETAEGGEDGEQGSSQQTSDYTSFDSGYDTNRSSASLYFDEEKHSRYQQQAYTVLQWKRREKLQRRVVLSVSPVVARLGYHDLQLVITIAETFDSAVPVLESSVNSGHVASSDFHTPKLSKGIDVEATPTAFRSKTGPLANAGEYSMRKATASNVPPPTPSSTSSSASLTSSFLSIVPRGHLDVRIDAVNLMLNNDVFGQNIPIAEARLSSVVGIAESTSEAVRCSMEITFESVYHNLRLMAWEPAIEPWRCRMESYFPKAISEDSGLKTSWGIGSPGNAENVGTTSATGGGTTAISSDSSDVRNINRRLPSRGLRQRTMSGHSGLSDLSERDVNYTSEHAGTWGSGTVTPAARDSPVMSGSGSGSPVMGMNGLGKWAGDHVGAEDSASGDLVTHRPSIAITSTSTLNFNVTEAVVENFVEVSKGWKLVAEQQQARKKQLYERKQSLLRKAGNIFMRTPTGLSGTSSVTASPAANATPGSLEREQFSLYRIRNETGLALKFWGSNGSARSMLLQPNQEHPMRFDLAQPSFVSRGLGRSARMITVVAQARRGAIHSSEEENNGEENGTTKTRNTAETAATQSSNTFENLILLRCEQVRVDSMGTSIHGMRSFDKNDYYLNGIDTNAASDGSTGDMNQDENSRIIAERAPSLICQVRSRAGSKIIHLRSPILLRNETDKALLFVIYDHRKKQLQEKEEVILWREVAPPRGTIAYPLHLSSNQLFVLKMVPCASASCHTPIAGADYCVVPFLEHAANWSSGPEILKYGPSSERAPEHTSLHIGCRVHYDQEAEDYLAETDAGTARRSNTVELFSSETRRRSNGTAYMRVLSFHPIMKIESTLPQSMQYRVLIETATQVSSDSLVEEVVPSHEQKGGNLDAKVVENSDVPRATITTTEQRARRTVQIHSEGILSPGASVLWYGPSLQQQYQHHRNVGTVSNAHQSIYIELRIPGFDWSERTCLSTLALAVRRRSEVTVPITLLDGVSRPLELQMELSQSGSPGTSGGSTNRNIDAPVNGAGVLEVSIYAPYWIHNASGLPLLFRHHGVQNDSRFRRFGKSPKDGGKSEGTERKFVRGTTTAAGQPGEMIDTDLSETSALASSSEGSKSSRSSNKFKSDSKASRATTSTFGLSAESERDTAASQIETESVFLGTGPRNMGLRELLPGPQGTERPGLREALSVGLVAHRRRFTEKKLQFMTLRPAPTVSSDEAEQKQASTPMSGFLADDYDYEEEALLRAGVFDDDDIVGFGDRAGNTNSVRPEDLLLLGYSKPTLRSGRLSVRLAKGMDSTHSTATFHELLPTDWSQPFGIDSAGTTGEVEIKEEESSDRHKGWHLGSIFGRGNRKTSRWGRSSSTWSSKENLTGDEISQAAYSLGVSIDVARAPFHRTKVISIMPRFVVVNLMGRPLLVKQLGTSGRRYVGGPGGDGTGVDALLVGADQRVPFHWADSSGGWGADGRSRRVVSVRFDEYGWQWSGGFPIHNVGEFSVRLRNLHTHASYICRVEVFMLQATLFVVFQAELRRLPPYRIENMSFATLHYHQEGISHIEDVLLPYQTSRYSWDEIMAGEGSPHQPGQERENTDLAPGNRVHGTFAAASADMPVAKRIVFTAVGTANQPHLPVHLGAFSLDKIAEYSHGKVSL
jgi:hypothetical protein